MYVYTHTYIPKHFKMILLEDGCGSTVSESSEFLPTPWRKLPIQSSQYRITEIIQCSPQTRTPMPLSMPERERPKAAPDLGGTKVCLGQVGGSRRQRTDVKTGQPAAASGSSVEAQGWVWGQLSTQEMLCKLPLMGQHKGSTLRLTSQGPFQDNVPRRGQCAGDRIQNEQDRDSQREGERGW